VNKRQLVSLSVVLLLSAAARAEVSPAESPLAVAPAVPSIDAASWVLMDATSGQILAAGHPDERRNPASLTKLMTGYVVDRAIDKKRISRDDIVTVGTDAWGAGNPVFKGSSLMFLKPGDKVSVRDLSRGVIIDSGNDACVALADYVAGSQTSFVALMNQYVDKLGMRNSHFETVHGLDAPGQFTTARDLALLSRAIIDGEPDFYQMYAEKSLTWNGITQQNRNGLLWDKTLHVDGLKTGHTESAGFNLIASSIDGRRRLIAVIMGGKSAKGREEQAHKLLTWGQAHFDTVQLFHAGREIGHEKVWFGSPHSVALGSEKDIYVTLPREDVQKIKARYVVENKDLEAPLALHQRVGTIELVEGDWLISRYPLVTLAPVNKAGIMVRIGDYIMRKL